MILWKWIEKNDKQRTSVSCYNFKIIWAKYWKFCRSELTSYERRSSVVAYHSILFLGVNFTLVRLFLHLIFKKYILIKSLLILIVWIFSFFREKLKSFLMSTKCSTGAFSLEVDGEVDIRGAYCAAAVATITNLNTDVLFEKTAAWILRCA